MEKGTLVVTPGDVFPPNPGMEENMPLPPPFLSTSSGSQSTRSRVSSHPSRCVPAESPPVWNLRAVIWFHLAISFPVLLPSPVPFLSDLFVPASRFFLTFSRIFFQYFSLRDRLFWYGSCLAVGSLLVRRCFEPSQPQRITSGLNTNFTLTPSYSFYKSSYHKACSFRGHSTREPASSRVTYFILRACHSQHRRNRERFGKKCRWMDRKCRNKQGRNPWQ